VGGSDIIHRAMSLMGLDQITTPAQPQNVD
jgi:hypothetical protein